DDVPDSRGRHVVRTADHGGEQSSIGWAQTAMADRGLAQVGGEEHHLDHAGGGGGAAGVKGAHPRVEIDHGEADFAGAALRVALRAVDARLPAGAAPVRWADRRWLA